MPTLQKIKSSSPDATARPCDPGGNKRRVDEDITVGSCYIGKTNETNVQRPTKRVKVEEEDASKPRSGSFNGAFGGTVYALASAAGGGNTSSGDNNDHDSSSLLNQNGDGFKKNDANKVNNATLSSITKSKGKKNKKPKDPNAPKKYITSYLYFCLEERPKLKERGMDNSGSALGEGWRGLTDEQKQPYEELAAADRDRYDREMAVYGAKNAGADSVSGGRVHNTNITTSKDTKAKKKKKDPNHPKGATGSYIFFQNAARAKFTDEHPQATDREVCTLISQKWHSMTQGEKKPYVEMNEEEKKRYEKEMVVYNANIKAMAMKREGGDIDSPPTQLEVTLPMFKDEVMVHDSNKNNESDEDDDSEDCPICHGKVNIWTDDVEVCNNSKNCGATFHKECISKYELEELEHESGKGCIACCVLKPEEDMDNAESLEGMAFIVEGINKNLASTIKAFGGLVSTVTDVKKMEKRANERPTTFFVVNKGGNPEAKVDQARKLGIPFIGPAKVRLLALEKTTISQCKAQPPVAVYYAGSSPESAANSITTKTSKKTSIVEDTKKASHELDDSPMHAVAVAAQMIRANNSATKSEGSMEIDIDDATTAVPLAGTKVDIDTKDSQIESNKENKANDEDKNPSMLSGLGKSIMASAKSKGRAALIKSGFALKKKKHATIVPEKRIEKSNEIIAGLEAMKKSVTKVSKGRIKSTDKDDDVCSTASSSSSDSLWGAGLPSKSAGSPGKCSSHDEVVEGVDAKQDSICDGTSLDVDFDAACDTTSGFDEVGTDNAGIPLNGDKDDGAEAVNAGAEQVETVSVKAASNDKATSCHNEPTQIVSNNSKSGGGCGTKSVSFAEAAAVSANKVIAITLELVPLSQDDCEKTLREKKTNYPALPYLVDDPGDEYNVPRKTITLQMKWTSEAKCMKRVPDNQHPTKVTLGRSKVTGIKWSALSRNLCDVSLGIKPCSTSTIAALLQMKKAPGDHALCINGSEHNIIVGQKFSLKHGDIISLYGRTGFAYRVGISISK